MRSRSLRAFGIALAGLVVCAPISVASAAADQTLQPDPASIALTQQDLPSWTQTAGTREEAWSSAPGPSQPTGFGDIYTYETDFMRITSDGGQQVLTTQAAEGDGSLLAAHLKGLQHDALGQVPIALAPLGDQSVAWWESAGPTRQATAAVQLGDVIVELHLSGVTKNDVSDSQIDALMSRLVDRANAAPARPPLNWCQLLPGSPEPWSVLLDGSHAGDNWQQQNGLDLISHELGDQVQSVSASRTFDHVGLLRRSLVSTVTAYPSADQATTEGMSGPGEAIAAPQLGDQAAAFKLSEPASTEAPHVVYTFLVRHGAVVSETQEQGIAWTLDSADETHALAMTSDSLAAAVLGSQ